MKYLMKEKYNEKQVLVVLTGGTICSEYKGNVKSQAGKAGTILEENFKNSNSVYKDKVFFKTTENFGVFSENVTVMKWNEIIKFMRSMPEIRDTAIAHGGYPSMSKQKVTSMDNVFDGIIIAHGTDTLAYSAALFSILFKHIGVPVFLVSSNEALLSERENGTANFIAAVECICNNIKPNVYVTYRNICDNKMYLHLASRLTQCRNYEEDFYSKGMLDISKVEEKAFESIHAGHNELEANEMFRIDFFDEWLLKNGVLKIEPYVGLNYDFYDLSQAKAILHCTYHSGTVCTEKTEKQSKYGKNSVLYLLDKCNDIPVYIAPSDFSGAIYDTIEIVASHKDKNVFFINGYTTEMLYIKLLIAISVGYGIEKTNKFLSSEYNAEFIIPISSNTKFIYP